MAPEFEMQVKEAAVSDVLRRYLSRGLGTAKQFGGRVMSEEPQTGAANLLQRLFSSRAAGAPPPTSWLGKKTQWIREGARSMFLGDPIDVARDLRRSGQTAAGWRPGSALRGYYHDAFLRDPKTVINAIRSGSTPAGFSFKRTLSNLKAPATRDALLRTAFGLGIPALETYGATQAAPEHRGEAVGRALGSIAAAPLAYRLGIPGQLLMAAPAIGIGGRIGRLFDPKRPPVPPEEFQHRMPFPFRDEPVNVPYGYPTAAYFRAAGLDTPSL